MILLNKTQETRGAGSSHSPLGVAAPSPTSSWHRNTLGAQTLLHAPSHADEGKEYLICIRRHIPQLNMDTPWIHTRVISEETSLWVQLGYPVAAIQKLLLSYVTKGSHSQGLTGAEWRSTNSFCLGQESPSIQVTWVKGKGFSHYFSVPLVKLNPFLFQNNTDMGKNNWNIL